MGIADFKVTVQRYWEEDGEPRGWDAFFISKVYAVEGNKFLVYDDGNYSASYGEPEFCPTGFMWVDMTEKIVDCTDRDCLLPKVTPYVEGEK